MFEGAKQMSLAGSSCIASAIVSQNSYTKHTFEDTNYSPAHPQEPYISSVTCFCVTPTLNMCEQNQTVEVNFF